VDGVIATVAGTGADGYSGDDGPASEATIERPSALAVGPDGSLYIVTPDDHRVRRVGPDGVITVVAGSGRPGSRYVAEGVAAVEARLRAPNGIAVGPDGELFVADTLSFRVRRVAADGTITTVAGPDEFARPIAVAIGPDRSLYIADPVGMLLCLSCR
jgi:sugar lactone lactonase YvrE